MVSLTAIPSNGWFFAGWSGDLTDLSNPGTLVVDSNPEVTATFTQTQYSLTVTSNPSSGGTVTLSDNGPYASGDVITLTPHPAAGYIFSGWKGDLTGGATPGQITINRNMIVTADFAPNSVVLTLASFPGGSIVANPTGPYHYGDTVQLTAVPDQGHSFSGWSQDLNGSTNPTSITLDGDKSVTASFTGASISLTLTANPLTGGTINSVPNNSLYSYGDVVQLTASPKPGYSFSGWTGDLTGSTNPTSTTMTSNKSVTANFQAITLDHFTFSTINSQTAGSAFGITITAKDANGNTVTSYVGTNALTASSGSISPTSTSAFTSGVWTGSVALSQAVTSVSISTIGGGKSGQSNTFTVNSVTPVNPINPPNTASPNALDHFDFNTITSAQTVSAAFSLTITAKDASDNTVTSYTGTNALMASSGKITPTSTSAFTSGVWVGTVTLSKSGDGIFVSTSGGGKSGISNTFTVNPNVLDHFAFSPINDPQTADNTFSITITAQDSAGNTVTTYTGANTLTIPGGTISPASTTGFTSGVWTGLVALPQSGTGVSISTSGAGASGTSNAFTVNPSPLDHFVFNIISGPQTAGVAFSVTITAKDSSGNTVTSYTGTNTLIPSSGTISPTSTSAFISGVWTDTITLTKAGTGISIFTVTGGTKTGVSSTFTVVPGSLDHFGFAAIGTQTAGTAYSVTVIAQDAYGNTITSYTGTPTLTSSSWSGTKTLGAFSSGTKTGTVTSTIAGSTTIIATDGLTGTSASFTVNPNVATVLAVSGFANPTVAGDSHSFSVTAKDAYGNTATGYTGTVLFSSSDTLDSAGSGLPSNYVFLSGDGGSKSFSAVLKTVGSQSITATDTVTSSITGSQTGIAVTVGPLDHIVITPSASTLTAGGQQTFVSKSYDQYNNVIGIVTASTTWSIQNGAGGSWVQTTGTYTSQYAGSAWTVTGLYSGKIASASLTVNPGPLSKFAFASIGTQTAGTAYSITITAQDAYGNTVPSYSGNPTLASSSWSGSKNIGTFSSGTKTGSVISTIAGSTTITATDDSTGTSATFTVNPGAASVLLVSGFTNPTVAGDAHNLVVTAKDAYGNTATGYTGTIHFTSSDALSTAGSGLPANYAFQNSDGGSRSFSALLKTVGSQSITTTDTTSSITGSQTGIVVNAGSLHHLSVNPLIASITAGGQQSFVSKSYDLYNNLIGTVTSSTTWSIQSGARGSWVQSTGTYSSEVSGSWIVTASYLGKIATSTLTVNVGSLNYITASVSPAPINAGSTTTGTATGYDSQGNSLGVQSASWSIPAGGDGGFWSGNVYTSHTIGTFQVKAEVSGKTATTSLIVNPGPLSAFNFAAIPSPQVAGSAFTVSLTAVDAYGNTVTSYSGSTTLAETDGGAGGIVTPSPVTFANGFWSGSLIVTKPGTSATITATGGSQTGKSNSFTVNVGNGTFGYKTIGSNGDSIENTIRGSMFTTPGYNTTAKNITAYIQVGETHAIKAAIYLPNGTFVASTQEVTVTVANDGWVTFNFASGNQPTLVASTNYILAIWANNPSSFNSADIYGDRGGQGYFVNFAPYGSWPTSVSFSFSTTNWSIYCTFSVP